MGKPDCVRTRPGYAGGKSSRATVIFTVSFVSNLSFAVLSPFVVIMLDKIGTVPSYLFVEMVAASGTFALYLLRKKQRNSSFDLLPALKCWVLSG